MIFIMESGKNCLLKDSEYIFIEKLASASIFNVRTEFFYISAISSAKKEFFQLYSLVKKYMSHYFHDPNSFIEYSSKGLDTSEYLITTDYISTGRDPNGVRIRFIGPNFKIWIHSKFFCKKEVPIELKYILSFLREKENYIKGGTYGNNTI